MCSKYKNRYRYNSLRYAGRDYYLTPHDTTNLVNKTMSSNSPKSASLSVVIRSYKSAVSKHAHKFDSNFSWQPGYYDTIICTTGQLSRIRKYILENTQNWNISQSRWCSCGGGIYPTHFSAKKSVLLWPLPEKVWKDLTFIWIQRGFNSG